ncbi:MAG: hypothetical protein KJ621_12410 [Proteobacteria bacterium]|nr:hypothetical protein [Pseudomonadota bacterium]MBU1743113.1 hypothetical protein [Pseudomonadota bacterium]
MWFKRLVWLVVILAVLVVGGWFALPYILDLVGVPPTGRGRQDVHVMLDGQGNPDEKHVRLKKGYGLILECVGQIVSPPGRYRLRISAGGRVVFDKVVKAGEQVTYRVFTDMSFDPTRFVHEIWARDGQRYVKVTYVFDYSYTFKSVFNRLAGLEKRPAATVAAGPAPKPGAVTKPSPTTPPRTTVRRPVPPPPKTTPVVKPPPLTPPPPEKKLPFVPWRKAD